VFIDTDPQFLQDRLVNRKIRGGTSEEDALDFYYKSDAINVDNVLNNSQKADLNLYLNQDGSFKI
jgi:pantothenate kinase